MVEIANKVDVHYYELFTVRSAFCYTSCNKRLPIGSRDSLVFSNRFLAEKVSLFLNEYAKHHDRAGFLRSRVEKNLFIFHEGVFLPISKSLNEIQSSYLQLCDALHKIDDECDLLFPSLTCFQKQVLLLIDSPLYVKRSNIASLLCCMTCLGCCFGCDATASPLH